MFAVMSCRSRPMWLTSNHPTGGAPVGNTPDSSVLDLKPRNPCARSPCSRCVRSRSKTAQPPIASNSFWPIPSLRPFTAGDQGPVGDLDLRAASFVPPSITNFWIETTRTAHPARRTSQRQRRLDRWRRRSAYSKRFAGRGGPNSQRGRHIANDCGSDRLCDPGRLSHPGGPTRCCRTSHGPALGEPGHQVQGHWLGQAWLVHGRRPAI